MLSPFFLSTLPCVALCLYSDGGIRHAVLARVLINDSLFVLCAISLAVCIFKIAKMSSANVYLESKVERKASFTSFCFLSFFRDKVKLLLNITVGLLFWWVCVICFWKNLLELRFGDAGISYQPNLKIQHGCHVLKIRLLQFKVGKIYWKAKCLPTPTSKSKVNLCMALIIILIKLK